MRPMRAWLVRIRGLMERDRRDREFSRELDCHLQMHIEDGIRSGMTPEEARRNAIQQLGGITQTRESYRERAGVPFLETLAQDLSYGWRTMRRGPGFAAAAILTLGLGIGATTAIFTVVYAVLLRPLPYPQPERLVYVKEMLPSGINFFAGTREFVAWRDRSQTLSQVAAYMQFTANLTGGNEAESATCGLVTAAFFPMLGVQPELGRIFLPEDDRPGAPPVAILSHGLWQRRFGGDRSAIGGRLALDGKGYTIVGVLPAGFRVPDRYAFVRGTGYGVWLPFALGPNGASRLPLLRAVGRLKPGVRMETARAELDTLLQPLVR